MTTIETLRTFIEHAPEARELPDSALLGVRGDGWMICRSCLDRIHRRGCRVPAPNSLIWDDQSIIVECDLKEFHP